MNYFQTTFTFFDSGCQLQLLTSQAFSVSCQKTLKTFCMYLLIQFVAEGMRRMKNKAHSHHS